MAKNLLWIIIKTIFEAGLFFMAAYFGAFLSINFGAEVDIKALYGIIGLVIAFIFLKSLADYRLSKK